MHVPHSWQKTTLVQHSHCTYCGTGYPEGLDWPRVCTGCGETTWRNPLPVAVVLLPVRTRPDRRPGLVVVRRDIPPGLGQLALPGGFIEIGETWQEAAVRELREETGLSAQPGDVRLFEVNSTPGTINVYGVLPVRAAGELPPSRPTDEASEWRVLEAPEPHAFPTHEAVTARYFGSA